MRPLRPLAALIMLASIWLWWRGPVIRHDIGRLAAAAHFAAAETAIGHGDLVASVVGVRRGLTDLADDPPLRQNVAAFRNLLRLQYRLIGREKLYLLDSKAGSDSLPRP